MAAIIATWIANSLAIYVVAYLMRGIDVASFGTALGAGAVLSLINALVRPVLVILTLPLTIVTLGFFYFVVSAFCLYLTSLVVEGFVITGVLRTIVAAMLVSLFSTIIHSVLKPAPPPRPRS